MAGGTVMTRWLAESPLAKAVTKLVDLSRLDHLRGVEVRDGEVQIGALTSLVDLEGRSGAMGDAIRSIANPNIRNTATLGGNLAGRFPGADIHVAALVLDAHVDVLTWEGPISLPIASFIEEGVPQGCLVTSLRYAADREATSRFHKFAWRSASGKTLVAVGAHANLMNGKLEVVRIAIAGLSSIARRASTAERLLEGLEAQRSTIEAAAAHASMSLPFELDGSPGERYRRDLASTGLRDLLGELAGR